MRSLLCAGLSDTSGDTDYFDIELLPVVLGDPFDCLQRRCNLNVRSRRVFQLFSLKTASAPFSKTDGIKSCPSTRSPELPQTGSPFAARLLSVVILSQYSVSSLRFRGKHLRKPELFFKGHIFHVKKYLSVLLFC